MCSVERDSWQWSFNYNEIFYFKKKKKEKLYDVGFEKRK